MVPFSESSQTPSAQEALASVNGRIVPLSEAMIQALDRGFLFGDAVYEVIRVYQGTPWLFPSHINRLASSLAAVRIEGVDLEKLQAQVLGLLHKSGFADAIIYIQITRGCGERRHAPPPGLTPLEFFFIKEFSDPYINLRQVGAQAITYPDLRWRRCDIKSTNLLGNVLAMQAAMESDCSEAILFRRDGSLTEGTHTSLFAVQDGSLLTTPQGNSILPGITGQTLFEISEKLEIPLQEHLLHRSQLREFDELFVTGTTAEVLPIISVDQTPIGDGKPGPITMKLQEGYRQAIQDFLSRGE